MTTPEIASAPVVAVPKTKKASKKSAPVPVVTAVTAEEAAPVEVAAPVAPKAKKAKAPKAAKVIAEASVEVEAKVSSPHSRGADPVVEIPVVEPKVEKLPEEIISLLGKCLEDMREQTKTFQGLFRELKVARVKELKLNNKKNKKVKRASNGQPHGFAKETKLHPRLTEFLGLPAETTLSSPKVTSKIADYVRENGLAHPDNKSIFNMDDKLRAILGEPTFPAIKAKPELGNHHSFWNLQKTLKKEGMFVRDAPTPVEVSA